MRLWLLTVLLAAVAAAARADAPILNRPIGVYDCGAIDAETSRRGIALLSPDGESVAVVHAGVPAMYPARQGTARFTLAAEPRPGWEPVASFSTDGRLLAVGRGDGRIEIVHFGFGAPVATLSLGSRIERIDRLALSPKGDLLAVVSGTLYHKWLRIYDVKTGKLLAEPLRDVDGGAYQLFYSLDGSELVANFYFNLYLVDARTFELKRKLPGEHSAAFYSHGKLYALKKGTNAVQEVTPGGLAATSLRLPPGAAPQGIFQGAIAGRGRLVALPETNQVRLFDLKGAERAVVRGIGEEVSRVELSDDGSVLLVRRTSGRVEIYAVPAPD